MRKKAQKASHIHTQKKFICLYKVPLAILFNQHAQIYITFINDKSAKSLSHSHTQKILYVYIKSRAILFTQHTHKFMSRLYAIKAQKASRPLTRKNFILMFI